MKDILHILNKIYEELKDIKTTLDTIERREKDPTSLPLGKT